MTAKKKILITSALPYANGPIHIGHLVEYIQTDVFVRFLKLIGEHAIYCCADDTHGTPIEIAAQKEGVLPEQIIGKFHQEHLRDFTNFQIKFDSYYSTNSPENKKLADSIFKKLNDKGLIYQKEVELTFCAKCGRFLPDRYVKGRCPKCGSDDQYGDVCEKCNATYTTTDLVEPFCTICGSAPERKISRHYFFKLSACSDQLKEWLNGNKKLQPEVRNYVMNWIKEGLKDWDISRDGPYFGFKIPGEDNMYYYVWLDAPIGYMASTENYCNQNQKNGEKFDDYWQNGRVIHFIGKDIIYFHFLFWPAMLMNSGFVLPENIVVHGFLTVNKEKMSKSRGTFFTAEDYLKVLNPEYLRFYYAANLGNALSDIDLDFNDFKSRINNELVANIGNFVYRALSFTNKNFDSRITSFPKDSHKELIDEILALFEKTREAYMQHNFREAVNLILHISTIGNKYLQDKAPWKLVKENPEDAQSAMTFCVNIAKNLSILIKPVLPEFSARIEKQLNLSELKWEDLGFELANHEIGKSEILIGKIENELDSLGAKDPFSLLDLRVAEIEDASQHPQADKLLVLNVRVGEENRQLVAGLKEHYKPEELIGKNIVMLYNLKPAKLRGMESQGMVLAAGDKESVNVLEAKTSYSGASVYADGIKPEPVGEIIIDDFAKIKIVVKDGKVQYSDKVLRTDSGPVSPGNSKDGARIG